MTNPSNVPVPAGAQLWLTQQGAAAIDAEPLTGDLGTRRYFRLRLADGGSSILALYPTGDSACQRFRRSDEILAQAGIRTPRIRAYDCGADRMLLEDVGPETWLESHGSFDWADARPLYRRAVGMATRIARVPPAAVSALNPDLDEVALEAELKLSWETLLVPEGLVGEGGVRRAFGNGLRRLCHRLSADGLVPAHRDFMVRNLVVRGKELVVLDHQDLRLAPPAYDLASLFNDSLFPPAQEARDLAVAAIGCDPLQYRRAVVQRCLKAVGSYRRGSRMGRPHREALIRPTLDRAWQELRHIPELASLVDPLTEPWAAFLSGG